MLKPSKGIATVCKRICSSILLNLVLLFYKTCFPRQGF